MNPEPPVIHSPPVIHEHEVEVTADDVRRLVASQFPQWSDRPVRALTEAGTDHRLFLLGSETTPLVARMPKIAWATGQAASDARWLPRLAPHLPLALPVPLAVGRPDDGYPFPWSVTPWLPGRSVGDPLAGADLGFPALDGARTLGRFVRTLRSLPPDGPPKEDTARGAPITRLDGPVRDALAQIRDLDTATAPDVLAATTVWERALAATPSGAASGAAWIHGDLLPGNLLAHEGRLTAVIDWGALGVGDLAVDLCPAWWLFAGDARTAFLNEATRGLPDDDAHAAAARARGWVIAQAAIAIPYYTTRWPQFAAASRRRLRAVL